MRYEEIAGRKREKYYCQENNYGQLRRQMKQKITCEFDLNGQLWCEQRNE